MSTLWREVQDYLQEFLQPYIRSESTQFYLAPEASSLANNSEGGAGWPGSRLAFGATTKWLQNLRGTSEGPSPISLYLAVCVVPHPAYAMAMLVVWFIQGGQSFNTSFFALTLTDIGSEGGGGSSSSPRSKAKGSGNSQGGGGGDPPSVTAMLCPPDVLNVVPLYRPTLKFATKVLAIIGLTGESALTRGRYRQAGI